jgi:hypothetical protein
MKIPGFNAEASLYQPHEPYPTAEAINGQANRGNPDSVQPALSIYVDGRYYCDGVIDGNGNVRCRRLSNRLTIY